MNEIATDGPIGADVNVLDAISAAQDSNEVNPVEDDVKEVDYSKIVNDVHSKVDSFTSSFLSNLVSKFQAQERPLHPDDLDFPAPYTTTNTTQDTNVGAIVRVNCLWGKDHFHYEFPRVDDYFGDIDLLDDDNKFDETKEPPNKAEWEEVLQDDADAMTCARNYFTGMIGKPLYQISDLKEHQIKLLNQWGTVTVENLQNKNQVLSQILGDEPKGDDSDLWITLIAFGGYGAHRTEPYSNNGEHGDAYFVNDVSFLDQYEVRPGYKKYGAAAYFGKDYRLTEIWVSHLDKTIKAPEKGTSSPEWSHAKWCWKVLCDEICCISNKVINESVLLKTHEMIQKVSVSVATFLVDHLAHNQLRESSGLIKALRELPEDHELRRLMLPFTYGTVHRMRVMNEYLREFGLFHRAFAFKYNELQRLIRDSMVNAPKTEKGQPQLREDLMNYQFKLIKKKVTVMKKLPDELYPLYTDTLDSWINTLQFVTEYFKPYYGEDIKDSSKLVSEDEPEIRTFYGALLRNCGIDRRFKLQKFNLINILAHFICSASAWNHHLHSAVSFEYSVDPDFTGLKILGNNATQNNIQNYVEYCCVAMCKGWGESDLMRIDVWEKILEKQRNSKEQQSDDEKEQIDDGPMANVDILRDYFQSSARISPRKIVSDPSTCCTLL